MASLAITGCVTAPAGDEGGTATPDKDYGMRDGHELRDGPEIGLQPHDKAPAPGSSAASQAPVKYRGGSVMLGATNVYYIWYGNWTNNTATTILTDLASNIGGSSYFNINTTYTDGSNTAVTNAVTYAGSANAGYLYGKSLGDAQVQGTVSYMITKGYLPKDPSGVYFVLTSSDVSENSGFCSYYCGWHDHATIDGVDIKYSFVGNAARCPNVCAAQGSKSPNGNVGADGMASILAHELEEAVTDPDLDAWYDNQGQENADKCAWHFGSTYMAPNGSYANMKLGSRDFLIQLNWVNASGGYCAKSY